MDDAFALCAFRAMEDRGIRGASGIRGGRNTTHREGHFSGASGAIIKIPQKRGKEGGSCEKLQGMISHHEIRAALR